MHARTLPVLATIGTTLLAAAQTPGGGAAPPASATAAPVDLNVSRVAIFTSGVAFFEREARVTGDATAELSFRTEQIPDMIKSMVVQDLGGGRIGAISYASKDPIERTLKSFAVDLTSNPTLGALLNQLRGEEVEIKGATSADGVIVGVEAETIVTPDGKVLQEIEKLTLLTARGLQHIKLADVQSIRLTNDKIDAELRKALATLAGLHDVDRKAVRLAFSGQSERTVRVSYLLEAPIWKTSYRLVLGEKESKPFMQGWATVENATESDWNNVRLALVSGRPISFRMDLYTPLYVPRPLETLEIYRSLRAPSYAGGFEVYDTATNAAEERAGRGRGTMKALPPAEPPMIMQRGGMAGEGALAEEPQMGLALRDAGVASAATGGEVGELFQYVIDAPVSIPRQSSAMIPIVNQEIDATKVSIFNPATHAKFPLNGLELKNTTGLSLMQGPVTVFDGNVYAGDAKLPDLKPDERRLVAYALDLAAEVLIKQQPQPDEIVSLAIRKGVLVHRHRQLDQREYEIKNKADADKVLIIEQPYSDDWKLLEPKEAYERAPGLLRFKVSAPAGKQVAQVVRLERTIEQSLGLSDSAFDTIQYYLRARVISPKVREALERVVALRTELDAAVRARGELEKRRDEATTEQARIRENLKTLDRSTDAYQRQLRRFDEVDEQIVSLKGEIDAARAAEAQKRQALEQYLLGLEVE